VLLHETPQSGNVAMLDCIGDFGTRGEARLGDQRHQEYAVKVFHW
jgi:hypothetical protein